MRLRNVLAAAVLTAAAGCGAGSIFEGEALVPLDRDSRSDDGAQPARAPLIGRSSELAQLRELLTRVERRRSPHLVTVIGEAGIGKSRLLAAFEEEVAARPSAPLVLRGRCLPYGSNVVYEGDTVYFNGDPVATQEQYAQQAITIAETGKQAEASKEEEWLPLGVFAMVQGEGSSSNDLFQLAVNKAGTIRGLRTPSS